MTQRDASLEFPFIDRRAKIERRQFSYSFHIPERRSGLQRRHQDRHTYAQEAVLWPFTSALVTPFGRSDQRLSA